jgi:putative polyhydroxyalkanoate system protein
VAKTLTLTVPHRLTQDEARSRIEKAIVNLRGSHASKLADVNERWSGNHLDFQLKALGQPITGRIDVLPSDVRLEVDLPWMLAMLSGRVRKQVEDEGRRLLEG